MSKLHMGLLIPGIRQILKKYHCNYIHGCVEYKDIYRPLDHNFILTLAEREDYAGLGQYLALCSRNCISRYVMKKRYILNV